MRMLNPCGAESEKGARDMEVVIRGLRQLLKEEKGDENKITAAKHCQALQSNVQQLLQAINQCVGGISGNGAPEEHQEKMVDLSDQLCASFSSSANILTLCKEVEAGPSWLFEALSSHLASLFKTTFSLIKMSTELLDKLPLNHKTFENVVSSLRLLCGPVLSFDPSLLVLVWRGMGRTVCRGKSVAGYEWTIRPIISDACIAMRNKAAECVQCAPRESEDGSSGGSGYLKLLKLCRFLSSLLAKLVQEFPECGTAECSTDLTNLLVHLYGCVPPSPHCVPVSTHTQAELETNILLVCEPVISALLDSAQFLQCLLSPGSEEREVKEGGGFGRLMCLCVLCKKFPKLSEGVQDLLMDSVSSRESQSESCLFLDAFFSTLSQCGVELQLPVQVPGVMYNGQPQRPVSLYDHTLTHIACFVACLPHRHFPKVEAILFHHVFCDDNTFTTLLAMDLLTFIARSEERLADGYVNLLSQLLQSSPSLSRRTHQTAYTVLRRMVPLLSPPHQAHFTQSHPPSSPSQLHLWAHLDLTALSNPLQTQVVQELVSTSSEEVATQMQAGRPDLRSLHWSLRCLHSSHSLLPTSHHHHSTITTLTHNIWDWVVTQNTAQNSQQPEWVAVVCDVIMMMADQLSHLPPPTLLQLFGSLRDMISRGVSILVCLAVSDFFKQCSGLKLPVNIQAPILRIVVFILQHLLCHPSWLVLHHTLEAFRHFVEHSPYASAVEECVLPHLNHVVVDPLQHSSYLSSQRPDMKQTTFWVRELRVRAEKEEGWRQGEWERGNVDPHQQALVNSKMQLLLDTWHELCTLSPSPDTCVQLHELCTSIHSHIQTKLPSMQK